VNIGELFVTLGVKGRGLGTLKDVAKMVANLPVDAAAAIAGMAGISLELGKMAEEAMATSVAFQMFSNQTGLSWQQLQRWQIVAEQANVSTQTMASSISQLERNIAEIRLGRGNIAPFQMLGIGVGPGQTAFGVLEQLRDKIKGINPATATNLISQMGLSPELMNVLRLTDRQFAEFASHVHGINERQQRDFLNAKLSITQLGQAFRYTMFGIISDLEEAWEKASKFKEAIKILGIAAAGAAIYFFPLTAALAALLLVLDDLAVYSVGGRSLFGEGIKGFDKFIRDLTGQHDFSILDKLSHLADIIERIQKASYNAGASTRQLFEEIFHGGLSGTLAMIRSGERPQTGDRNMENHINIHVNNDGPLDAPGWGDVAHMVRKSVEDAHLQLNN
jgi:hypothetical protein